MGVPKFFRWISERYPCLSEIVREFQLPEFDNLYLDMNGIIHMCSHPNDFDPHFRITEEKIFKDIFHYIEVLFRMIQPQKLFFMAVDGVAPRAKMNQQRGRRFRSAKEAEVLEKKAKESGEELPSEERFDSNCITPGTVFMARLHEQLKYFVVFKISTDKLWQNCKVILSGHETPGEGEHKIMDYIRYMKSQPDYDPNTRHCLYGLDADLIMLGLCTHEPHFSLLREEVKFGKQNQKRISTADETKFYLLHLSLLREYLEMEFGDVKDKLPFEFNLEKIIDDWVLMGFLVGNDFIPHLPLMHIHEGALPVLYQAYIAVLPSLDGYINESGTLNLERFQKYMEKLSEYDVEQFQETLADLKFFEGKTGRRPNENKRHSYKTNGVPDKSELQALINSTNSMYISSDEDDSDASDIDQKSVMLEFSEHKRSYYMNKLEYHSVDSEVLRIQAEGYVRAIQWNLNYYYNGVCSWSWYYPHNYAPYISDINNFSNLKLDFDMGKPFLPFEQLLAVLPAASKNLLPEPYHHLMVDANSPIIDYYPRDFKTDLNGKKQEWEAVVLIPFIDETTLLKAMKPRNAQLTEEESNRNSHGPMFTHTYTGEDLGEYQAPEYFPGISSNHAVVVAVDREQIQVERHKLVKGLCPGVMLDVFFPGFPTLKHIKYTYFMHKNRTVVFEHPSRGDSMMVKLVNSETPSVEEIAKQILGKIIFVSWPHLCEARVVAVSNREVYSRVLDNASSSDCDGNDASKFVVENMDDVLTTRWRMDKSGIQSRYLNRLAVDIGETKIIVHATNMIGRRYVYGPTGRITLEKQWCEVPTAYAFQATVKDIAVCNPSFVQYKTLEELFPPKSTCFMIGPPYYGAMGEVMENSNVQKGRIKVKVLVTEEPDLSTLEKQHVKHFQLYMNSNTAAQKLGISAHLLSRVTGTIFVVKGVEGSNTESQKKFNIGLNLKFNKKNEEVPGYTRKDGQTWLYSHKAIELVKGYIQSFPEVFEYLAQNTGNDVFYESHLFPQESNKTTEIVNWLKEQPYSRAETLPCGSDIVDEDVVRELENTVDDFFKANLVGKSMTMHVKPHVLYKDGIQSGTVAPDQRANYRLFDRVVNVRDSHTVPLGLKGTITGMYMSQKKEDVLYQVVYDKEFDGGLPLNCSGCRAYKQSACTMLNLSYGRRMDGKARKPLTIMQPTAGRAVQSGGGTAQANGTQQNLHLGQGSPGRPMSAFAPWDVAQPTGFHPQALSSPYDPTTYGLRPSPPHWNQHAGFKQQPQQQQQYQFQPSWHPQQQNQQQQFYFQSLPGKPSADYQAMWTQLKVTGKPSPGMPMSPTHKTSAPQSPDVKNEVGVSEKESFMNMLCSPEAQFKQKPQEIQKVSVKQLFEQAARANNSVPKDPQNYCMQLLTLCQQKGLGIPIYNYSKNPMDGSERAHVKLPGKQTFTGDAPTQAQAAEKAAQSALGHMTSLMVSGQGQGQSAGACGRLGRHSLPPTPPQQWCAKNNHNTPPFRHHTKQGTEQMQDWRRRTPNNAPNSGPVYSPGVPFDQQKVKHPGYPGPVSKFPQGFPPTVPPFHHSPQQHQQHPQQSWRGKPQQVEAPGSPFVPLQAVKQRSKSSATQQASSAATTAQPQQNSHPAAQAPPASVTDKAAASSAKPATPKPLVPKPKKSRIAANFNVDVKSCDQK